MSTTSPTVSGLELPCYVAGEPVLGHGRLDVLYPYTGEVAGTVPMLGRDELDAAIEAALAFRAPLSRYERYEILALGAGRGICPPDPQRGGTLHAGDPLRSRPRPGCAAVCRHGIAQG